MAFRDLRGDADAETGWKWRWGVIGGGAVLLVALIAGATFFLMTRDDKPQETEVPKPAADVMFDAPQREYTAPPSPPPPQQAQVPEPPPTLDLPPKQEPFQPPISNRKYENQEAKTDPIAEAQNAKNIGEWSPQGQQATPRLAPSMEVSYYDSGACTVPSGSAIKAELISAAITTNASTVKAIVTNDVLCTNGDRGIMAGAVLVGDAQKGADFGSERMDLVFTTLQQGDMEINLEGAASGDGLGKGGHPGQVNRHNLQTAFRVAIATAVDLAIANAGGDSVWSPLVGTPSRAVNDWARKALDRDPVITIDGSRNRIPITIITKKSIAL